MASESRMVVMWGLLLWLLGHRAELASSSGSPAAVSWLVEPASLKIPQSQPAGALATSATRIDLALQAGECESRQLRLRSSADVRDVSVELPAAGSTGWRWADSTA